MKMFEVMSHEKKYDSNVLWGLRHGMEITSKNCCCFFLNIVCFVAYLFLFWSFHEYPSLLMGLKPIEEKIEKEISFMADARKAHFLKLIE